VNGEFSCPFFDGEMTGCQLAERLSIYEQVNCSQARYGWTDEEYRIWLHKDREASKKSQKEPELPDNPIPFPDNCPLKVGSYTISLI